MPRRGRISRGGGKKGPVNQVWTVIVAEEVGIGPGTIQAFNIVQDSDWAQSGGSERATILRTRGAWSVTNKFVPGSFAGGAVMMAIFLLDEDAASPDPSSSVNYVDEDVLWSGSVQLPFVDAGTAPQAERWIIDVKAMRKLRKGQELRLVVANGSLATVEVTGVLRALVRRGAS